MDLDCLGPSQDDCPTRSNDSASETGTDVQIHGETGKLEELDRVSMSPLENLPPELRTLLLSSMPDLPTLRCLVRASATLHAQYRCDRSAVLRACLDRELDGLLVDAYAASESRVARIGSPRTDEKVTNFLDTYQAWLSGAAPAPYINSMSSNRVRWLAALHLSVIRPLVRAYSQWALSNLERAALLEIGHRDPALQEEEEKKEAGVKYNNLSIELSRSEEIRIYRALYRCQIYHDLFGRNKGRRHGGFRHHEINEMFFCMFDPWEAEAIGCIDLFMRAKYEDLFSQVKPDLDPENPRFLQGDGILNPEGSVDLEKEHDDYMDGTVSRGLKIFAKLLAVDNHDTLVTKMERCLTHNSYMDALLVESLGALAQDDRRQMSANFPLPRDEAEQRRDPLDFVGDTAPPNGPPSAWCRLWNGKYANICGEYVPESVRRWGYVMWDERRWNDLGAQDLVARQWETAPQLVAEIKQDYDWRPSDIGPEVE